MEWFVHLLQYWLPPIFSLRIPLQTNKNPTTLGMLGNFSGFWWRLLTFFKINLFKKIFQEHHQRVKQFWFRSGATFCRSWSESKLLAKVISRRQKLPLARKELTIGCDVAKTWNQSDINLWLMSQGLLNIMAYVSSAAEDSICICIYRNNSPGHLAGSIRIRDFY